ncbi:hypothetical protein ATANTOWER_005251 [Ataeniobius toweri]|uniref:Uncharacterized protein n=1 Tax=Ataeniobius toweri TaxID=208326 RepID=A0ABU7BWW0_9TELE|nr:hypothetical protein [Ataeniobius toweri]
MPDQISVSEFLSETTEDYNSPTTSSFTTRMQSCRNTVNVLEEMALCVAGFAFLQATESHSGDAKGKPSLRWHSLEHASPRRITWTGPEKMSTFHSRRIQAWPGLT